MRLNCVLRRIALHHYLKCGLIYRLFSEGIYHHSFIHSFCFYCLLFVRVYSYGFCGLFRA